MGYTVISVEYLVSRNDVDSRKHEVRYQLTKSTTGEVLADIVKEEKFSYGNGKSTTTREAFSYTFESSQTYLLTISIDGITIGTPIPIYGK